MYYRDASPVTVKFRINHIRVELLEINGLPMQVNSSLFKSLSFLSWWKLNFGCMWWRVFLFLTNRFCVSCSAVPRTLLQFLSIIVIIFILAINLESSPYPEESRFMLSSPSTVRTGSAVDLWRGNTLCAYYSGLTWLCTAVDLACLLAAGFLLLLPPSRGE